MSRAGWRACLRSHSNSSVLSHPARIVQGDWFHKGLAMFPASCPTKKSMRLRYKETLLRFYQQAAPVRSYTQIPDCKL